MSSCAVASSRRRCSARAASRSRRRRCSSSVRAEKGSSEEVAGGAGGMEIGAPAGKGGGGSRTPGSVETSEGATRVGVGSAAEEADGPREEDLSAREACKVRRRRRRALASVICDA